MKLHDVTVPLRSGMPVFEGDRGIVIEQVTSLANGGPCNLSAFSGSLHAGTHVDAPIHFIESAGGVETLSPEALLGPCVVVDAPEVGSLIPASWVSENVPRGTQRILFRTTNGPLWDSPGFRRDYTALSEEAARELAARDIRLAGIDYMSVAPFDDPAPVHRALLGAGIVILEGLDLRGAAPGRYELICLPMLIPGADGAPARVFLREP